MLDDQPLKPKKRVKMNDHNDQVAVQRLVDIFKHPTQTLTRSESTGGPVPVIPPKSSQLDE
jgi:hypothetical protein